MDNALTPREIQTRIRSGASAADVAEESGWELSRVEAFAGPVLAEREHVARAAQSATIRRRGESGSHRKLGDLIFQRLTARGFDAELVEWDAWRQPDLKWRVLATLTTEESPTPRVAEFIYDAKARFSLADNKDARWMIGEEAKQGSSVEDENTVDFHDELALVRAVTQPEPPAVDVPSAQLMQDTNDDTSQLDRLYDMLSGISEDSVRIYTGFLDDMVTEPPAGLRVDDATGEILDDGNTPVSEADASDESPVSEAPTEVIVTDEIVVEDIVAAEESSEVQQVEDEAGAEAADLEAEEPTIEVSLDELTGEVNLDQVPKKKTTRPRKRRASVPSWDEIMFGGPSST